MWSKTTKSRERLPTQGAVGMMYLRERSAEEQVYLDIRPQAGEHQMVFKPSTNAADVEAKGYAGRSTRLRRGSRPVLPRKSSTAPRSTSSVQTCSSPLSATCRDGRERAPGERGQWCPEVSERNKAFACTGDFRLSTRLMS